MPLSNAMLLGLEANILLKTDIYYKKQYKHTPASRKQNSEFFKIRKQLKNPDEFFKYMRMSRKVFEYLFENTEDVLNGMVINLKTISAREKLFLTIQYLVTGMSLSEISAKFCIGRTTAYNIIKCTVETLCNALSRIHLRPPTHHNLAEEAEKFYEKWKFPNCVGVIGAHYVLFSKMKSGALMAKKRRSSVLLTAVADSDSRFQCVDISTIGDDRGCYFEEVYKDCGYKPLPGSNKDTPFVLIGNEGFPLLQHIIRPYSNANGARAWQKGFNDKLHNASAPIDIAFEVLMQKFKILTTTHSIKNTVQLTVKATCLLYNVILDIDGENDLDFMQVKRPSQSGDTKKLIKKKTTRRRPTDRAVEIRADFNDYLSSS